jgi:hypothetical protein
MAKFINNSAAATIARRAAACGLNLAVVAEAIKTASANYASTAQHCPANPHHNRDVRDIAGVLPCYQPEDVRCTSEDPLNPAEGDQLTLIDNDGHYVRHYTFKSSVWAHAQTEDWEWADQVHLRIRCEGYALYSGIRADVARLLDIPITNDLHWAFDHALRILQEGN